MSASPARRPVLVGLFVAGATVILAGGILTIGDLRDTFTRKIAVTAVFDEVSGLQQGDNVWFSGVKVGTVTSLEFHGEAQVVVALKIERKATEFIHGDALAKLGSDGLIGNKIVVIYGGTPGVAPIMEGAVMGTGVAVSTEQIMATLQDNNQNLLAITTDLKGITSRINAGEGTLGKLLTDDTLYTDAARTMAKLDAASTSAGAFSASLATFGDKLNRPGALPTQFATDQTTWPALVNTVARLQAGVDRGAGLVDGLADSAENRGTPVGALLHDEAAGHDLKVTLDNLNRASGLLSEDLEAAQHNFLLRGFFKKREKAAAKAGGK